ncbi:hypothetical protein M434DRAFT_300399 [Hypoxylon sp. CO27-5]|nr:hypothetical protein M434DRAFT_300399 [Hypoxylon sp. CO27-5]
MYVFQLFKLSNLLFEIANSISYKPQVVIQQSFILGINNQTLTPRSPTRYAFF